MCSGSCLLYSYVDIVVSRVNLCNTAFYGLVFCLKKYNFCHRAVDTICFIFCTQLPSNKTPVNTDHFTQCKALFLTTVTTCLMKYKKTAEGNRE